MKRFVLALTMGLLALAPLQPAEAAVTAKVSLAKQRMEIFVDGTLTHTWPVSTGRQDFDTPEGAYTPTWLDKDHRSQKYDDAPMPFSVFFRGGYAVHGTNAIGMLGRRASHGCVRLSTPNAKKFFEMVQQHGLSSSKVVIHDAPVQGSSRHFVAEIGHKNSRSADVRKAVRYRELAGRPPMTGHAGRTMPTPAYSVPPVTTHPVIVYQIGPSGQLIPAGYRRF